MERTVRGRPSRTGLDRASMPLPGQVMVPAQHRVGAYQQPHPAKRLWPQPVQQRRQQSPVRRREAHLLPDQLALQYRGLMAQDQEDAAPRTCSPQSSRPVATAQPHIMPRRPPAAAVPNPVQGDVSPNLGLAGVMHLTLPGCSFRHTQRQATWVYSLIRPPRTGFRRSV